MEIIPLTTFESLGLRKGLLETLAAQGYQTPTPIQAQCIPPALEGRDILGCAQTGTGKTAAFSLPMIQRLIDSSKREWPAQGRKPLKRRPRALILAPTRELAVQIEESLRTYGRGTGKRGVLIYGGVKQGPQVRQLKAGVDVIIATPGRLLDLMDQGHVDLNGIEMLVLDEADHMLDMGFIKPIRQITRALPAERQTYFFSATMPPKIRELASSLLSDPVSISVAPVASTAPDIEQGLYHVAQEDKTVLLKHLLADPAVECAVVFSKTKHGADKLAKVLGRDGITASAIHGNRTQSQRERTLKGFRSGTFRVLVATDVAARGLDISGVSHVFNFNLPMEAESYVHRIGRTGRAGATGKAVSFCSKEERGLLRSIERLIDDQISVERIPVELDIQSIAPRPQAQPARKKNPKKPSGGPRSSRQAHPKKKPARNNKPARTGARGKAAQSSANNVTNNASSNAPGNSSNSGPNKTGPNKKKIHSKKRSARPSQGSKRPGGKAGSPSAAGQRRNRPPSKERVGTGCS